MNKAKASEELIIKTNSDFHKIMDNRKRMLKEKFLK